jgi:tRNA pseudouridine13 synthase
MRTRWPRAAPAAGRGVIRTTPADFRVEEWIELADEPPGEHLWLRVRKTGENTAWVAKQLARAAAVETRAVGYAGRKDRHAVTTQWFSVQLPGRADPEFAELPPSIEILERCRRNRKLQVGGLRGNRFAVVVRRFEGDATGLEKRLRELATSGVPNYFGSQRFGRKAGNLERALAWFRGEIAVRDRDQRSLLLSAARAQIFNALLARRVADGTWCQALPGDLVMLDGRGSFFPVDPVDETIAARLARGEIHPSGALWGRGRAATRDRALELEEEVAATHAELAAGLEQHGLQQERRALRLVPQDLSWEWQDAATLRLDFTLTAGAYATTLLEELLELDDTARGEHADD